MKTTIITYWLADGLGGVVIDPTGDTVEKNVAELRSRYGARLLAWEAK